MNRLTTTAAILLAMLMTANLSAQPRGGGPTTQRADQTKDPADFVIEEISFQDVSLADMVAYLRDTVPELRIVLIDGPNMPPGYPHVSLRMKKVTIGQVLQVLQSAYNVDVESIGDPSGQKAPVYVLKSQLSDALALQLHYSAPATPKIYPLTKVLEQLPSVPNLPSGSPEDIKRRLNDLLTVLQSALDAVGDVSKPTLVVHEATQTLLFKGSLGQQTVLETTLASLMPTHDEQIEAVQRNADREIANLKNQAMQIELRYKMSEEKNEMLNDRLKELTSAGAAATPAKP